MDYQTGGAIMKQVPMSWADVTLAKFAALRVLRQGCGLLDAYWDATALCDVFGDGTPTRLTESGEARFESLQAQLSALDADPTVWADAAPYAALADDLAAMVGWVTVVRAGA